ncbi:MAG: hypothetical protein QX189_03755 [Methylococcales bacterium]
MKKVQQAISHYEAYRSRLAQGLLNATTEKGLTGGIRLTDSQIQFSFMSREFLDTYKSKIEILGKYAELYGDKRIESGRLFKEFPEVQEALEVIELGCHEIFHGIQKHSYRSVFSLVEKLQSIEDWEVKLFFGYAVNGGKWAEEDSFLVSLNGIDSDLRDVIASYISKDCKAVLEATNPRASGLSFQHLIEGQALVASRLSIAAFESLPLPDVDLYTAAWLAYKKAGGIKPLVFVLVVGAALRYGDISDGDEDSSFYDFYPHPVDIFHYLLNFVEEIEAVYLALDNGSQLSRLFGHESGEKYQSALKQLKMAVSSEKSMPIDSTDSDLSYVRHADKDDFDDEDEREEYENRFHNDVFCPFDELKEEYAISPDRQQAIKITTLVSKSIATIIESAYSRVASPMKGEFPRKNNKKIADAVANDVASFIPDYYQEETLIRVILDQEFTLGKLFRYFLSDINERVKVKPFDAMPEITHIEYLSMCLMPNMIKNLLYSSRYHQDNDDISCGIKIYCCEKHGAVSINDEEVRKTENQYDFFDFCGEDDAVARALMIMCNRTVTSFFED